MAKSRVYVGNLSLDTEEKHLKKQFSKFGNVSNLEFKNKCDIEGKPIARFAYLNLEADNVQLNQCVRETNGSTLKGNNIKVEIARESFLDRLKREREQKEAEASGKNLPFPSKAFDDTKYNFNTEPKSWQRNKQNFQDSYSNQTDNFETGNEGWDNCTKYNSKQSYHSNENFNANFEPLGGSKRSDFKTPKSDRSYNNFNANFEPLGPSKRNDLVQNDQNTQDTPLESGGHANHLGQKLLSGVIKNSKDKRFDDFKHSKITSAFKRYDPTAAANQKKVSIEIPKTQPTKSFAEVSSDLKFTENSSSFSLLAKFSEPMQDTETAVTNGWEDIVMGEEEEKGEVEDEPSFVTERLLPLPEKHSVATKSRNFFIRVNDSSLQEGVSWLLTPLTAENKKEFEEMRNKLLSVCKRRKTRAERQSDESRRIKKNGLNLLAKSKKKSDEYWERNKGNKQLHNDWIRSKDKKFSKNASRTKK